MEYQVVLEPFTQRHYIKSFAKKYKTSWDFTLKFLCEEFRRVDILFGKSIAETIVDAGEIKICKTEFRIAGTQVSRHGSGNRCIVAIHKKENKVRVLLVYHKNDLGSGSETADWKRIIKENYPEYAGML